MHLASTRNGIVGDQDQIQQYLDARLIRSQSFFILCTGPNQLASAIG